MAARTVCSRALAPDGAGLAPFPLAVAGWGPRQCPRAPMNILSIQSFVAFGHVGNRAAMLPLERLGHEVWPVNTVLLAHHPGYGAWHGRVAAAEEIMTLIGGLE